MRLVIQRVKKAGVSINETVHNSILNGCLVFIGIAEDDTTADVEYLALKLCNMRIFSDQEGKMNLDIKQINGELLLVSQFTLHASSKKGNRPSFIKAARPEIAIPLYQNFIETCNQLLTKTCKAGVFGADMQIELINDGPVTIILDSKNRE